MMARKRLRLVMEAFPETGFNGAAPMMARKRDVPEGDDYVFYASMEPRQ